MSKPTYFTISETLEKFRRKEISPVEVVTAHLNRAMELQPKLNAFVHFDAESALARARKAEERFQKNESIGALEGIPLTMKSNMDVAGWPCTGGSLLRKDNVPVADAVCVMRMEAAGGILIGNTNTPEFMMSYESDNRLTGKTSNPWNLEYSAGGSSGGEAAAIASGSSIGGVGSDGGGSIRTPAHFSGICGFKPTPGRVASTGHFPPSTGAFAWLGVIGPMARTVADVRALFSVVQGGDDWDPLSAPIGLREISEQTLKGLRVGVLEVSELGRPTPETLSAMRRAVQLLADAGFRLEPMALQATAQAADLWWFYFGPVIGNLIRETVKGKESELSPALTEYLAVVAGEENPTFESFIKHGQERDALRSQILRKMHDTPILISPVSTEPAFKHGEGNFRAGQPHNCRETMRFCQWLNLAGFPGISLPFGHSPEGLPINLQLIGRPYEEELLLAVAERLEQARGPWQAPPI